PGVGSGPGERGLTAGQSFADHEVALVRRVDIARQGNGLDLDAPAEDVRRARTQRPAAIGVLLIAADKQIRWHLRGGIVGARQAVLLAVGIPRDAVRADVMRLEERPETVIVHLRDWIILMIVTASALHRQTEQATGGV